MASSPSISVTSGPGGRLAATMTLAPPNVTSAAASPTARVNAGRHNHVGSAAVLAMASTTSSSTRAMGLAPRGLR
jgi:hypothetical protein